MEKTTEDLSREIKQYRKNQNLGVKKFCRTYSISEGILRNIEKHKVEFNDSMYITCSKILNIPTEELKSTYKKKQKGNIFSKENKQKANLGFIHHLCD